MDDLYDGRLELATGHLEDGVYKDLCIESLKLQFRLDITKRIQRSVSAGLRRHRNRIFLKLLRMRSAIPPQNRHGINKLILSWESRYTRRYRNVVGVIEDGMIDLNYRSKVYNKIRNVLTGQRQKEGRPIAKVSAFRYPKKYDYITKAKSGGCVDCGATAQLSFDHLPGSNKVFDIGSSSKRSLEEVKKEISKCEIVCRPCHDIRERKRGRM